MAEPRFQTAQLGGRLPAAGLPTDLRETPAFQQIDALCRAGRFQEEGPLEQIAAFRQAYPASARLAALAEYELAAWWERDAAAAAAAFEQVLAWGFRHQDKPDGLVVDAAGWRLQLALMAGDHATARRLLDWVN